MLSIVEALSMMIKPLLKNLTDHLVRSHFSTKEFEHDTLLNDFSLIQFESTYLRRTNTFKIRGREYHILRDD
jgi:hypothetical protein